MRSKERVRDKDRETKREGVREREREGEYIHHSLTGGAVSVVCPC